MKRGEIAVASLVVVLDQWAKAWIRAHVQPPGGFSLGPWIDLTLVYNRGAAFSLLSAASGWQNGLFIAIAVAMSVAIVITLGRLRGDERITRIALSLVLGGALGNLVDRLRFGEVVDFIDFHVGSWHWYVFNLADAAITLGAVLLLIDAFVRPPADRQA